MKPRFIITVDTEADRPDRQDGIATHNLSRLGKFHELCIGHGIRPTYLCTYEVITSEAFNAFHQKYGGDDYEIGAHLHPWSNPPFVEIDRLGIAPYPTEYPHEVLGEKLRVLVSEITKRYMPPRSYRAGRYGFSTGHIPILRKLGISIDCSVTPFVSWENAMGYMSGGPDYWQSQVSPYFWSTDGYVLAEAREDAILEVPITILPTSRLVRTLRPIRKLLRLRNLLPTFVGRSLFSSVTWLRPYPHVSFENLKEVIDQGLMSRLPVLVMFLHSNELHEKHNPYFDTKHKVEHLHTLLEKTFLLLKERSIESITLSEFGQSL